MSISSVCADVSKYPNAAFKSNKRELQKIHVDFYGKAKIHVHVACRNTFRTIHAASILIVYKRYSTDSHRSTRRTCTSTNTTTATHAWYNTGTAKHYRYYTTTATGKTPHEAWPRTCDDLDLGPLD